MRRFLALSLVLWVSASGIALARHMPRVVAHRGLFRHAPENTLAGFRSCLELRIGFEVDVQRSKDGALVCVHDATVDRTTDGRGKVADLTLQQLRSLDAGSWFGPEFKNERIPTFAEVLQLVRGAGPKSALVAVDLKAAGIEAAVIGQAKDAGVLDRLLFIGTAIRDAAVRKRLRAADASAHVACLADVPEQLDAALADDASDWVYFRYLPARQEMARVKAAGKQAFIAGPTVAGREPVHWRRTVYAGLDGVLTDYPLDLAALLREVQRNAARLGTGEASVPRAAPLVYGKPEQVGIDPQRLEDAASVVQRSVAHDELRGAVVLVARRGKIVLHEAYGFRDAEQKLPMQRDTLFRMASNSKALTSAGILALVQNGLVQLDDPVSTYIPAFGNEKSREITIRQLLTHTSGLRIPTLFLEPLLNGELQPGESQLLREVARFGQIGPEVPPGTTYAYNNAGYNTLAGVIEAVTGSYKEHLRSTFYEPLGMRDSCNHESDADLSRFCQVQRQHEDGTWETRWRPADGPDLPFPRGSGGMVSTALDYAAFCQMMLHGGAFDGRRILNADLVRQATSPQRDHIAAAVSYGLGWMVSERGGVFSHSGSDGTWLWIDPRRELIGMLLTQTQCKTPPRNVFRELVSAACLDAPGELPDVAPAHAAGFYKDVFLSGGAHLTSRKSLPAAESLGLSCEYYAGPYVARQNELIVGSEDDENGVLLYPDGAPRFRLVYVNGGSCAGSFLSGRNVDDKTQRRLGYLHIFPYNTLNTGLKKARLAHVIPEDSPLLAYRSFGEDRRVDDVYHNNGNWLSLEEGPLADTEVLATYDNPGHKIDGGAAIWAYRKNDSTGRVVAIGSHPEGVDSGPQLALTEACLLYALDGVGGVAVKGDLSDGKLRRMDRRTSDDQPELTRIGDRQYHQFRFRVAPETPHVRIELQHDAQAELNLYLHAGEPAFQDNADHAATRGGSLRVLEAKLAPGEWFVSVHCATGVNAVDDPKSGFYRYYGNTELLNGVPYTIQVRQSKDRTE